MAERLPGQIADDYSAMVKAELIRQSLMLSTTSV
jgi:hypothetical protein